jgi:hypothetical protein
MMVVCGSPNESFHPGCKYPRPQITASWEPLRLFSGASELAFGAKWFGHEAIDPNVIRA